MLIDKQKIGKIGERLAAHFLLSQGYTIHCANFRFQRSEIDLIAQRDNETVFVEVKTRSSDMYGYGEESLHFRKQKALLRAISEFIRVNHTNLWRVDVLSILLQQDGSLKSIDHFCDVFNS